MVGEVGMGVVPGDERRGRVAAGKVLAGDAEVAIGGRAVRVDHGVVTLGELVGRNVPANFDVAEEAEALARGRLLVDADDRLDLGMVGRDAGPHEPERGRQAVEHVHFEIMLVGAEQMLGRVEPGRPGADDCDAQRGGARLVVHWRREG